MTSFADRILSFYQQLRIDSELPPGVDVLNPYQDEFAFSLCHAFYHRYYNDNEKRTAIIGINPGRLGGGITGIPFTDPIKLEQICGIPNSLQKKAELSADFIYKMIESFGGSTSFYQKFYFSSVSPLGFTKDGKNLNYYDIPELEEALSDFIIKSIQQLIQLGTQTRTAFVLGEGKNFKYFSKLNEKEKWFNQLIPLAHPRFIMQYRRKNIDAFVDDYCLKLRAVIRSLQE